MRYRIVHRTEYSYAPPAHESFNEVRLRPVSDGTQTCLEFSLAIDPPASVIAFDDYYGNAVHDFGVPYLHDNLAIEATSDVITFAAADDHLTGPRDGELDLSPPLSGLAADEAFADEHAEFLFQSTYIELGDTSGNLAKFLFAAAPMTSAYAYLRRAAAYVHDQLGYRVGATTVKSTVADVLAGGSGVCQDFSHVLISLCRHAGLPARYVSGYLGNIAESPASHAWTEVFVPPYGWVGIDPTAGAPASGRHVKVAVGRDYADVAVARGTYRGGEASNLRVKVTCEVIGNSQSLGVGAPVRSRSGLIQYQTLGAMKQLQRLDAIAQSLGSIAQSMSAVVQTGAGFTELPGLSTEGDAPRQQPQQQQQQQHPRNTCPRKER